MIRIYGLKSGDEIRYIGQTKFSLEKRLKEHIRDNKTNKRTSWIKSLISNGLIPEISLIDEYKTRDDANEKEIHYIKLFKSFGAKLVNDTVGGVAPMKDKRHSDEWKQTLSKKMSGANNHFYGKTHSEETKQKMSEKRKGVPSYFKGKKFTEDHKKKLSEVRKDKISKGLIIVHNKGVTSIDKNKVFELNMIGLKQVEIAKILNCDASNISRILNNKYEHKRRKSVSKVSASLMP